MAEQLHKRFPTEEGKDALTRSVSQVYLRLIKAKEGLRPDSPSKEG